MAAIRVLIHGATGKMGVETVAAVCRESDMELVGAVCGTDRGGVLATPSGEVPMYAGLDGLARLLDETRPDAMVDFTNSTACMEAAHAAAARKANLVLGASGLNAGHHAQLDALANDNGVGIIVAPNFALGAIVLKKLAEQAAPFFDYVDIVESHHEMKIDAPSGFSLALANSLAEQKQFSRNVTEKENLPETQGRRSQRRHRPQRPAAGPQRPPRGGLRRGRADGHPAPRHAGPRLLYARRGPLHPRSRRQAGAGGRPGEGAGAVRICGMAWEVILSSGVPRQKFARTLPIFGAGRNC